MTIANTKNKIVALLLSTEREGMNNMLDYMMQKGFFEAPASMKFHGSYQGGLAEHSWLVYDIFVHLPFNILILDQDTTAGKRPLPITPENIMISCLLHDICKLGAYIPVKDGKVPYRWNKAHPKGHATLSIKRIKKYIEMEPIEAMMIRFHMGVYGLYEFYDPDSWDYKTQAEYHIRSLDPKPKNPTPEEKKADQDARYCKSLRNCWYHNPICKFMYFADEMATMQDTLEG